jgi:hypothetical protein
MSLEMAHKVILPPKKNYIPQFLKQRDINSYYYTVRDRAITGTGTFRLAFYTVKGKPMGRLDPHFIFEADAVNFLFNQFSRDMTMRWSYGLFYIIVQV